MKPVKITGCILLLAELMLSIVFYQERIFLDGSYYFFHVVQSENFCVEHQRYILILSQLLACAGSLMHLPLNTLLLLNSINPVLYDAVLFYLIAFRLRQEGAAWALLLNTCCGVYFLYFCPMYEVWYGTAWLILFAALLHASYFKKNPLIFDAALLWLLFAYPLLFIGAILLLALNFLLRKNFSKRILIHLAVVFAVWLVIKNLFLSDYEAGKIDYPAGHLTAILSYNFQNTKNIFAAFSYLAVNYFEAWIPALAAIIYFFIRRQKIAALLVAGFSIGYLLLLGSTQSSFWEPSNYNERMLNEWIELGTLPFFLYVFSEIKMKSLVAVLVVSTIVLRLFQVTEHASYYENRISEIQSFINDARNLGIQKGFVDLDNKPEYSSLNEWSLPIECLIFSSLQNDSSVIISNQSDLLDKAVQSQLTDQRFQLRLQEVYDDRWLNQRYFHLKDLPYKQILF